MNPARLVPLADRIDRLNGAIGRGAAWLALFIVLVQFAVVVLRYAWGTGSIWLQESIIYAHAAMFMLAAGWVLQTGAHVRVDIFYADASPRQKAIIDLLGTLLLLLPFAAVLIWFSVPYVARSFAILERSREASGVPFVYLLKSLIPIFAVLLVLQGFAQAIRAAIILSNGVTPGLDPGVNPSSQDGLAGHSPSKTGVDALVSRQ